MICTEGPFCLRASLQANLGEIKCSFCWAIRTLLRHALTIQLVCIVSHIHLRAFGGHEVFVATHTTTLPANRAEDIDVNRDEVGAYRSALKVYATGHQDQFLQRRSRPCFHLQNVKQPKPRESPRRGNFVWRTSQLNAPGGVQTLREPWTRCQCIHYLESSRKGHTVLPLWPTRHSTHMSQCMLIHQ